MSDAFDRWESKEKTKQKKKKDLCLPLNLKQLGELQQ